MTLRPVTPGRIAVRPYPTDDWPEGWCCVTVGAVEHYRNPVEVDGLLHAYALPTRSVALYAARLILARGWLPKCGEREPVLNHAHGSDRCLLPLGHAGKHGNSHFRWDDSEITFDTFPDDDGLRLYDVHPESVLQEARLDAHMEDLRQEACRATAGFPPKRCEEIDPDTLEKCHQKPAGHRGWHQTPSGSTWSADSVQQDEAGRCEEIDTWSKDTVQCQLPAGHEGMHRHRTGPELTATVTQWRSRTDLDRDVEHWLARAPERPLPVMPVTPFRALCRARRGVPHSCNKDLNHTGPHHFTPEGPTQ